MKVYLNPDKISIKDQNVLKQWVQINIELNPTIISDILMTHKKGDGSTEKTLIYIIEKYEENFKEKLQSVLKNLESEDAWIILFSLNQNMDESSETMLELFKITCDEINVMIFPVLDFFEIRDWISNHIKASKPSIYENLKELRNEILLEELITFRRSFTDKLPVKKANKEFSLQYLENPGLCIQTYYQNKNTKHLYTKEDFTHFLNQTIECELEK